MEKGELIDVLGNFLEEETTLKENTIADKWKNGKLNLQPNDTTMQSKELNIEVFFTKIIRVRDNLRVLEQRINSNKSLSSEEKLNIQQYISKAYGTLTTFNVFFKDKKDYFVGAGASKIKSPSDGKSSPSLSDMQKKLGLNEY